jgi:hypothetical protein
LRAALRVTDETNLAQLYAIVAVFLVAHTPLPAVETASAPQIWPQLDREYGTVMTQVCSALWNVPDLDYLASVGVLRHVEEHLTGSPASRLERTLSPGGKYWVIPTGQAPHTQFKSHVDMLDSADRGRSSSKPSLRGYEATPVGKHLATAMIESLRG